ncbi:MAG: hypothetical protein ACLVJO_01275 [[Clostridium] scindens]
MKLAKTSNVKILLKSKRSAVPPKIKPPHGSLGYQFFRIRPVDLVTTVTDHPERIGWSYVSVYSSKRYKVIIRFRLFAFAVSAMLMIADEWAPLMVSSSASSLPMQKPDGTF